MESNEVHSRGTRHVGIVVKELMRSREFYQSIGFISEGIGDRETGQNLSRILGVEGVDIVTEKFTLNVLPGNSLWREDGFRLELIEYQASQRSTNNSYHELKSNDTIGKVHICFTVDDLNLVLRKLKGSGFEVPDSPFIHRGALMTYLYDPNGVSIELIERIA